MSNPAKWNAASTATAIARRKVLLVVARMALFVVKLTQFFGVCFWQVEATKVAFAPG